MWTELVTHSSWALSAALALVVLGIRALSDDEALRRDLRGAAYLFVLGAVSEGLSFLLPSATFPTAGKVFEVAGALSIAFGLIRSGAAVLLYAWRRRRGVDTPKILRDVIDGGLYLVAVIVVLRATLHVDLASLLTTSAILSVVIGLALQETLSNLFAGLSLQIERPFTVGDTVSIGSYSGKVVQLGWRTTRLAAGRGEVVTLPNNLVAKEAVQNFSRGPAVARDVIVAVSYAAPPNLVRQACLECAADLPNVMSEPAPTVTVVGYADAAIQYRVRFFGAVGDLDGLADMLLTRLWYRFGREGIDVALPQRVVTTREETAPAWRVAGTVRERDAHALLSSIDFLRPLGEEGRGELARRVTRQAFAAGEVVVRQSAPGDTFYVVVSGEVSVEVAAGGASTGVARLRRGDFFGEMSLLTGEPRAATVVATSDCELLSLDRGAFSDLFGANPDICRELSEILGRRRAQIAAASRATGPDDGSVAARAESSRIFGRLRDIFRLRGVASPPGNN